MRPMTSSLFAAAVVVAAIASATCAQAQHVAAPPAAAAVDMQGDARAFVNNAYIRAFYELSKVTLGPGAPKVDVNAYEARSFAIFRSLGASMGENPEGMQDHLKLIPRQVIQIVKDDPSVLDTFENFTGALIGPE